MVTGRGIHLREREGRGASEEAEEDGGAEHEEPDDVDEQQRLARDGRGAGADLAVAAASHAGPRAGRLGAAAPVRDPVGAADRVRAEAPHRAQRDVAVPVRDGGRAGVAGLRRRRGGGRGEEEARVCARRSESVARRMRWTRREGGMPGVAGGRWSPARGGA
ncbi:unnamed protein product [Miscanthus lutarioriparius]|uniref:Uncharacterized protein n=1 Tax=Miscanthus lutarioriparius TaxID=422564 RepID=A0A811NR11_9POAL|nr:unnamed protein product [Miscanthus lutarioriparius]